MNAPPSGSPPSVGSLIPVRLLGSGGMGEVWLARDEALGVDRAVKRLLPERAGDASLRARFVAEARTLAALGDVPGVVRVHAAGEDSVTHLPFFVMDAILLSPERVRAVCARRLGLPPAAAEAVVRSHFGSRAESSAQTAPFTLQDALGSEADGTARQLPERAVLSIAREIAAALAALHGHAPPVVHRDLKPSNLLFAADGRLLLADFGVAKTLDKARKNLTRNGVQPGTKRYAAPELRRGAPATPAADWYSLGIVLYRALTSSFPEWGADFPTHEGLHPFSPLWEPLLRDLLNPDPARRLADGAEFARWLDALERLLDTPRHPARRVWIAAGVAAAVVPAALLAVIVASGRGRSPSTPSAPAMESRVEGAESVSPAERAENSEPAPVSGRARSPSAPSAPAMESRVEGAESVSPAESAENSELVPVSGRARSPSAPPAPAVVSPAESVESVSPAERAENSELVPVSGRARSPSAPSAPAVESRVEGAEEESKSAKPSPGEVRTISLPGGVPLDLVWVPPGTFTMGLSEKERAPCATPSGTIPGDANPMAAPRPASVPRGFWLAKTELTQEQYAKIEYGKEGSPSMHASCPQSISWRMAERTIWSLNRLGTGFSFRMPTETEWEWAARGGPLGGGHAWSGSDDPDDVAWTANSWPPEDGPAPAFYPDVATKRPNELGLFDMSGSFAEWCSDRYVPPVSARFTSDRPSAQTEYRVVRGGDVFTPAACCRNGSFNAVSINGPQGNWIGLRLAADALP